MSSVEPNTLSRIVTERQSEILAGWMEYQRQLRGRSPDKDATDLSLRFLDLFRGALAAGQGEDILRPEWMPVRELLTELSQAQARRGVTSTETATFILSLKQPIFSAIRHAVGPQADRLADETWHATLLLDRLGLFTTEVHQRSREEVIARQQQEMMELSTPVVTLWEGILALPVIGTLDSARTQVVMENLLQRIVDAPAELAIIDITGVPTVDTLVAQHLLKTVAAARLMGADCIISGIRPQIAQTIVHLGVELGSVITKATLADAFAVALRRRGLVVSAARQAAALEGLTGRTREARE